MNIRSYIFIIIISLLASCASSKKTNVLQRSGHVESAKQPSTDKTNINNKEARPLLTMDKPLDIDRKEFIQYARQFMGIPYVYASSDPAIGFDCSGFLYHVFRHFYVKSPRSSYDYENIGKEIDTEKSKPGDLILFTGSDGKKIGHIGIVTDTKPQLSFIHASTSRGVIVSPLSGYYVNHFVKVIRVLR